ncbi:MAG: IS1182 family transposase [Dehalococcoidia bacterium]|nr:MAG: IS1182 family transposase [Dehalococcoidia bacterium]
MLEELVTNLEGLFQDYDFSSLPQKKQTEEKKPRIRPIQRNQMILHPIEVDRLIPEYHEARAIWEITGSLDLSCYYDHVDAVEGGAGAPAFDPRLLVSLWVYSYSKGISSSREIARLSKYDPAYQWLTGMRPVGYHTLADFRSAHKDSLRQLFVEILAILTSEGLVTMERVMHDGTRIKASAGRDTFRGEKRLHEYIAQAEAQVKAMEEACEEEMAPRIRKARERAVRERKERLSHALGELEKIKSQKRSTQTRVSITDPECRIMGQSDGGYAPAYNVQLSTDAHEKAIIAVSVSQSSADQTLCAPAMDRIEETTGRLPEKLVVDGGFTTRNAILAAERRGIDLIGSLPDTAAIRINAFREEKIAEAFYPEHFLFDPERNVYICPEEKILAHRGRSIHPGKTTYRYQGKECKNCPSKPSCCPHAAKGRFISRIENDPIVEAFIAKMKTDEAKAIYRQRGEVAEFPNAWIKEKLGLRQFHMRGLLKAEMEALWASITYNIKLWIRLCWKPRLEITG